VLLWKQMWTTHHNFRNLCHIVLCNTSQGSRFYVQGGGEEGVLSSLATLAWLSLCRLLWKCENLSLHRFPAMSPCRVYVLRASTSILSMRTNVLPRVWVTPKIQHFWALCCCITRLDNSTMRCNNHFLDREEQVCLQKATW